MSSEPNDQNPAESWAEARRTLTDMLSGYRITQMLHVTAKLGIADLLEDGPQEVAALAKATGAHEHSLYRLLRALVGLGVFSQDERGRFELTPLSELLRSGVPGSLRPMALYFGGATQWDPWGQLLHSITTGEMAFNHVFGMDPWQYRANNPELNAAFNEFMAANTTSQAAAIVAAYDFSTAETVVDVGGGHGALISAILRANPQLRGILCDAPHVVAGAAPVLKAAGVADCCEVVPCDFFASVPQGGDLYILKFIIHDWADEQAVSILKSCRRAMQNNGRLLVLERVVPPGNSPIVNKTHDARLTDLQMLVSMEGEERTEAQFATLFRRAGFQLAAVLPTQSLISIIEAVPA